MSQVAKTTRAAPLAAAILLSTFAWLPASAEEPTGAGAGRPFWRPLAQDHWKHVVLVVGAALANDEIDRRIGPRHSPLLFGDPPGFDQDIRDRFRRGSSDTGPHGFIEKHSSTVSDAIAAATIVACNAGRWREDVNDFLGWWEAGRFNRAATGIVKNLVGRERPRLEFAAQDGATPAEIRRLDGIDSNHQSFYSYHASSAFTTLAYADLVLSRRLHAHPVARRWSHAGLYTLGAYIAWARVLQDGHYFSDVVTGSIAGAFVGRSFYSFNHPDGLDHRLSWDPLTSGGFTLSPPLPIPGGVQISARIPL